MRSQWPLWSGLVVTVVVAGASCGVADERPPNRASVPASSAERAIARAERAARAHARTEQAPAASAPKPAPKPAAEPPPPADPEPEPEDAGAPDAEPADAGAPDATVVAADAGTPADAGPPDPAVLCEKTCDKVISCMRSIVGGGGALPPGIDEERLTSRLREECLAECTSDIDEHLDEASACLEIEDCSDFLDCIKAIDED
jgi:hypothetical protein